MAFSGVIIAAILVGISILGILLCVTGLILLIVFLVRRKTKKKKGLFIASVILLIVGLLTTFTFPVLISMDFNAAKQAAMNERIKPEEFPVNSAIVRHDNQGLKKLLKNGADPNEKWNGHSALLTACINSEGGANYEAIKILIDYHADVYAVADNDAGSDDQLSIMKYLLTSISREEDQHDFYKIAELFIESGYQVNETDRDGVTLLMYVAATSTYDEKYTLTYRLTELFVKNGADVNAMDHQRRTVLMWACDAAGKNEFAPFDLNTIKYLIENGANSNSKDNQGNTALDYFKLSKENAKRWVQYDTVGTTENYLETCRAIEECLQNQS